MSQQRFDIKPTPMDFSERIDFFGNRVAYFAIQQPTLSDCTAISDDIFPGKTIWIADQMTWTSTLLYKNRLYWGNRKAAGPKPNTNRIRLLKY